MFHIQNFINGSYCPPINGWYTENPNPALGESFSYCPDSDASDVELAVEAAEKAFPAWSHLASEKRFMFLNAIADLIDEELEQLALDEATDQGKPLWLAKAEVTRAAQNFRFYATAAHQFASELHHNPGFALHYTLRQPLGVVACISPWNLPLYLFTWKIAPALAAGNCVVAKPSEITPLTAFRLGEICRKAGLPAGVLNIVQGTGPGVGEPLVRHQKIKAISFTGGTQTGSRIASITAPLFKKVSLELGGKNPGIIFADADLNKALETTLLSAFQNQGEICLCTSRLYIEQSIYTSFKEQLIQRVNALKVGDPMDPQTRIGAIVSRAHFDKVMGCIERAKNEGATVLTGGNALEDQRGWFIQPTLLEGLTPDSKTQQEEIFGPVATLTPFQNDDEAIALANNSQYGLASTLWTSNLNRAHLLAEKLDTGIVWVNCWLLRDLRTPFGGMKHSGVGREGGWEAMRFFTEPKSISIKY